MTAILGAGVSGLSAAYYALENPKLASLVILEASNRVGGWVRSKKQPDGTVFEQGPRTIRMGGSKGENVLELVEQLGLSNEIVPVNHAATVGRLIYADNQLHSLPTSLRGFVKKNTLLNRSFLSCIWKDLLAPKTSKDDESVYSFVERRLSKDVADKVFSSVICGICAGDAREISIKSLMNDLFEYEKKHGSITKGFISQMYADIKQLKHRAHLVRNASESLVKRAKMEQWRLWGIKGGLEQLPKALADNVTKRGVNIKMKHKCEQLKFHKDHAELIVNGEVQKYSNIISSLPAKDLASLIQEQHPELSKELKGIPTVTVGIVNLQFPENALPVNGFGALVPPNEELPILGVTFDSCILPENSKATVLTVMMGGAWFEKYFSNCSSEEHLLTVALDQLREMFSIEEDPMAFNVSILKDCIPQYIVGHTQRLDRIRNYISTHKIPLWLCGSSYQGVGVPDIILSAKQVVSDIDLNVR